MTELPREQMEVWNIYRGLHCAVIICFPETVLSTLQDFKLFGIIQMEILFTLTVLSVRYLMGSIYSDNCTWHRHFIGKYGRMHREYLKEH